jgi:hypothetical protein
VGKFILIAFGFLGFSFYELSGGSDFDGEALRLSRVEASPAQVGLPKITVAKSVVVDAPTVTRAAFNLVSTETTNTQAVSIERPQAKITQASLALTQDEDTVGAIILPSLITGQGADHVSQVSYAETGQDLRLVTGNLVNVRGGPGTHFDVVGKLTRGAEVEVLAGNGDGWVEMRSVDGATLGWMADFLLSEG